MSTTTQSNEKDEPAVELPVSLRDYFAAKAMAAYIVAMTFPVDTDNRKRAVAALAYDIADEMLKARGRES